MFRNYERVSIMWADRQKRNWKTKRSVWIYGRDFFFSHVNVWVIITVSIIIDIIIIIHISLLLALSLLLYALLHLKRLVCCFRIYFFLLFCIRMDDGNVQKIFIQTSCRSGSVRNISVEHYHVNYTLINTIVTSETLIIPKINII